MNENTYFILTLVLSLFLGFFFLFRFLRVLSSSQHIEKITLTREDLEDIKEVLGLLRMKYENSDDDFSKAELRKIEDLRTFFIYISNRPSVLVEVKKSLNLVLLPSSMILILGLSLMLLMYTLKSSKQKTIFVLVVISVLSLSLNSSLKVS